ncbi:hypothetical protein F5B21DRAFT_504230 [Xylaria acuta]|nr:hypothetical protein F5B21DRAFT_504230 [Xylaria acuta]
MRTLLFTFFVYASFTNAASLGVRSWQEDSVGFEGVDNTVDRDQDRTTFSRLLSAVSPRALQQLVHEYVPNAFKDGVFSSDRNAGDVYIRGPALATSIVHLAVRQATSGNDTSTSDTPTSSDVPTTSTSDVPSTTPTEEPTTSTEEPTTSTDAPPTETTETPPDTPTTSSSTTPAPTPTPTTEPSSTTETPTETPDPTSSSPSSTPAPESSSDIDSSGSTPDTVSTSTTATPTSKTSTFTSTLPNGAVTTVTEVAVVTPGATEGDDGGTPTSGIGNLQTDSPAPIVRGPGFGIIAGLLVGGVMLA